MKVNDVILENKDRLAKKIEKLNQEIEIAKEKTGKAPAKLQKELDRLVMAFPDFADYQAEKQQATRQSGHDDMLARIKTANFGVGTSTNLIAAEAGDMAIALHMLRDVPGQFDDDIANVLMSFNGKSKTNPPTKQEIEIAKAVITRAGELGVLGDYKKRAVKKLDKDKMKFDYDKEESEFEEEL